LADPGIGRTLRGMAGYAAMMRIDHAAPRFLPGSAPDCDTADLPVPEPIVELPGAGSRAAIEDVSGQPFGARLAYLWDDIRDTWRQGMNVLRDPAWR
jgi:hypothetical protein